MYLEVFSDNPYETNCWLMALEGKDEAVVVDPGFHPERVHKLLADAGKRPVAALATHGHFDHIGFAGDFCGSDIPFYIHKDDELALTDPQAWGAGGQVPLVDVQDVRTFVDGEVLAVAGFSLEVVHTPGHTPGSSCFRVDEFVFSGDLVFRGSVGRTSFPNSFPGDMVVSLRRFLALPDQLDVYPGHGPATTVRIERATNPFLRELG
jgi:glyoxylase-like metal-dependent hydrolase (beta-lactamase superfamily II)